MAGAQQLDARTLRQAIVCYHGLLATYRAHLNHLNVFPVPDGDTGANLELTIEGAVAATDGATTLTEVCEGIRRGVVAAARGISGVVTARFLATLAAGLERSDTVTAEDLAEGLVAASRAARAAVVHPVDGTILTVADAAAAAATDAARRGGDVADVLDAARDAAAAALERTPELLPALADAGVVDSGGAGLVLFFDALVEVVTGRSSEAPPDAVPTTSAVAVEDMPRYEVVVRLVPNPGNLDGFRSAWSELGDDSTVVVADEGLWLAHIHTDAPDAAVAAARRTGEVREVQVTDLHEQVLGRRSPETPGAGDE